MTAAGQGLLDGDGTGPLDTDTDGPLDTDTDTDTDTGDGQGSAQATVDPRRAWRAARAPVLIAAGMLLVVVLIALRMAGIEGGYLDPRAPRPPGSRALARILPRYDTPVTTVVTPTGGAGTTTLVTRTELVPPERLRALLFRPGTDVVVVEPVAGYVDALGIGARVAGEVDVDTRRPGCTLPEASTAGAARVGGLRYRAPGATSCYGGTLLVMERGDARVVLVGSGEFLTNERLDDDGNAALALGLLTRRDRVEWAHPRPSDFGAERGNLYDLMRDLLPGRVVLATTQLFVAVALLALWRARRLGPVVVEPLPVVVRAAEAVEGRARLYEAGRARDRAAALHRRATRDRLASALGLGREPRREAVVEAVAARSRRGPEWVDALLYGPPPADDDALVALVRDLDSLDREVRST